MTVWTVSWFCRQICFYATPDRQSAKQRLESGYPPQTSGSSETIATEADGGNFSIDGA